MMRRVLLVCGLASGLVACCAVSARAGVVAVWVDPGTGIRYERHDVGQGGSRTRDAYQALAQSIHPTVHLATIPNAATNAGIFSNLVSGRGDAWIGFYQPNAGNPTWEPGWPGQNGDPLGGWRWFSDPTNSRGLTYTNWGGGEPNNSGGEHCAHMRGDGAWNDHNQTHTLDGIIEYPAGYLFPRPVAQLATYGGMIQGKAFIHDPNTGAVSPPDRYVLEVKQNVIRPGIPGIYGTNAQIPYPWPIPPVNWSLYPYTARRVDQNISFPHPLGAWAGLHSDFSAVWVGLLYVPQDGTYRFWGASDDRAWLAIDGVPANGYGGWVGNNNPPQLTEGAWDIGAEWFLTQGYHTIEFRSHEFGGDDWAYLRWQKPGDPGFSVIPSENFYYLDEWRVLSDVSGTQVGDLLNMAMFPPDGRFGLNDGSYELRLTVWGAYTSEQVTVNFQLVPEPTSLALLGLGLAVLARRRRK